MPPTSTSGASDAAKSKTTSENEEAPVEPPRKKYRANWRLNQLSKPVARLANKKYEPEEYKFETNVPPAALKAQCTMRSEHMARPPIRTLETNKSTYGVVKGEKFMRRMDKKIEESWNSIYNYYKKAEKELGQRKKKSLQQKISNVSSKASKKSIGSKASKKSKSSKKSQDSQKELEDWCSLRSQPKAAPEPEPIDRGKKIEDLDSIKDRLVQISTPKRVIPKYDPEDEFWKDPYDLKVNGAALTYEPTERIMVLSKPSPGKVYQKPEEQPTVKQSALEYNASERVVQLAQPKKKSKGPESDVREDAFVISKGALKYVATPRILELARPIER